MRNHLTSYAQHGISAYTGQTPTKPIGYATLNRLDMARIPLDNLIFVVIHMPLIKRLIFGHFQTAGNGLTLRLLPERSAFRTSWFKKIELSALPSIKQPVRLAP